MEGDIKLTIHERAKLRKEMSKLGWEKEIPEDVFAKTLIGSMILVQMRLNMIFDRKKYNFGKFFNSFIAITGFIFFVSLVANEMSGFLSYPISILVVYGYIMSFREFRR